MDTIFALASARGKAGVSVIRVSGPAAFECCQRLTGSVPQTRRASLRKLCDLNGAVIDRCLVVTFAEDESFTGEETVEFQTHGSISVVNYFLGVLAGLDGLRLADAGEFTRRALMNDRMDLAEIEGLGDLIEAETEAQRKQAMRAMSGTLRAKVEKWRNDLVRAMSLLEATIDFADEEVPVDVTPEVMELLERTVRSLRSEAAGVHVAERLADGFKVAIVGAPNSGKSTLLNHIAGRDVAIVSDVAGTTRDIIEVRTDIRGIPVTIVDTAGLRSTDDKIERMGVDRARQAASDADLRIHLVDSRDDVLAEFQEDDLILHPKDDLGKKKGISGKTGFGVANALSKISEVFEKRISVVGVAIKERQRLAIVAAIESLEQALSALRDHDALPELVSDDIRAGVKTIESLVGRVDVEDLLDEIFSSFCIGK